MSIITICGICDGRGKLKGKLKGKLLPFTKKCYKCNGNGKIKL